MAERRTDEAAEQCQRRCGTCRGFRPESGECRMGLPTVDADLFTAWPKPPLGAADPGCELWAEAVRR